MESGVSKGLSWGRSPGYEQPGDLGKFKANVDRIYDMANIAIMTSGTNAMIGAVFGGIVTAPAAGIGAPIGAAVAGGVTFFLMGGVAGNEIYKDYREFQSSLDKAAMDMIDEQLFATGLISEDNRCAITNLFPNDPVRIRGERQVYERAALESHIKKCGNSPATRKALSRTDVEAYPQNFAMVGIACDRVLNAPGAKEKHAPVVLRGVSAARKAMLELASAQHDKEYAQIEKDAKSKKLSSREIGRRYTALSDIYDPILGKEASSSRVELNDGGRAVPLEQAAHIDNVGRNADIFEHFNFDEAKN